MRQPRGTFTGHGALREIPGKAGLKRWGLLWHVRLFEFTNDQAEPTVYRTMDGQFIMPDNHFTTDGGSTPPPLRGLPIINLDPWAFPRAYVMHDSMFKYGGAYVFCSIFQAFVFVQLEREQCDDLLLEMVRADGAGQPDAVVIHAGVQMGSWLAWDEKKQAEARRQDGINIVTHCPKAA